MTGTPRSRRLAQAALSVLFLGALAACAEQYPNSTFLHTTEFNTAIDALWNRLLLWGTIVFVIVEAVLIYTIIKYRNRPDSPAPKQVHGNTALEITWTVVPAIILVFIAIPTVRTIVKTQAKAPASAITVEVYGHQWWWEFRYPEQGVTTANELYLPIGRTVNFALRTKDVLHSFWIPNLGGKRDLISNKTNYLWFTPDSSYQSTVANGQCAEYCGDSHANMKFRVFTVSASDFDKWVASQKSQASMMGTGAPPVPPATPAAVPGAKPAPKVAAKPAADTAKPVVTEAAYMYPGDKVPDFTKPKTPYPAGLTFDDAVLAKGDADAGRIQYSKSMCIGCHMVSGNPMSQGVIGPNLTHIASRYTIAAGLFPNDAQHLARWIKNSRAMKPGVLMPTLGMGEWDPVLGVKVGAANGGLTDQQIADIVAYLRALK